MTYYVSSTNKVSGTFDRWEAPGDFTISGVLAVKEDTGTQLILGLSDDYGCWIGRFGNNLAVRIGSTFNTELPIPLGDNINFSIVRVGSTITCSVGQAEVSYTNSGAVVVDTIGVNPSLSGIHLDLFFLNLINGTDDRTYDANSSGGTGTQIPDTTSNKPITMAGPFVWLEGASGGDLSALTIESAPFENFLYQRGSNDLATVTKAITWTGIPAVTDSLQYKLINADTDTTIVDWTTFDSTPSGGASTLQLDIPAALNGYNVQVRFSENGLTSAVESTTWFVGDRFVIAGQSLALGMAEGGAPNTDSMFRYTSGAGSVGGIGEGAYEISKSIVVGQSVASMMILSGTGGTPLTKSGDSGGDEWWANPESNLYTTLMTTIDAATDGENRIAFLYWHQGTEDGKKGVSFDEYAGINYTGGLSSLISRFREVLVSKDGGRLPIFVATVNRFNKSGSGDTSHQTVRDAILRVCNSDDYIISCNAYPIETGDGVHGTDAGYTSLGKEIALLNLNQEGLVSASSPLLSGVVLSDDRLSLTLTFDQTLNTSDSAYSTEGIYVESGGVSQTVTSYTKGEGTKAIIQLASPLPTGETLKIAQGYGVGTSNNQLLYPRSVDHTLPNGMGSQSVVSECFNVELFEV